MAVSIPLNASDYSYFFFVSIAAAILLRALFRTYTRSRGGARLPPGPLALPILGHTHLLKSSLPKSFQTLAARYGPLMQIRVGGTTFFVVSDASIAKEILKTHDVDFASKFEAGPAQYNIYKGTFVNAPYGNYWRFVKKLCVTKLFSGPQLNRFINIREQETVKLIKSVLKRSADGEPCDLSREFTAMTNKMIYKMMVGRRSRPDDSDDKAMKIRNFITDVMINANKFHFGEVFGPLKKLDLFGNGRRITEAIKGYDKVVEEIMKDYENNEADNLDDEEKDLMDILLETHKDSNSEVTLTRDHIKYFFMEMFMAAVDTTSAAIQWAMAELLNHPRKFKKLREEIDSVVGQNRVVKESDVSNLPYLQAVIKETLRLHPPGPLLRRQSNIDSKLNGYDVKAGTRFFINVYMIMRDPNRYKEPDRFLPERFLINYAAENVGPTPREIKGQDFHFLPFGSGRRSCPGVSHAYFVMHGTLGALVQCFDWKAEGGEKIDIKLGTGFSGAFPFPLVCYPITRFDPLKP